MHGHDPRACEHVQMLPGKPLPPLPSVEGVYGRGGGETPGRGMAGGRRGESETKKEAEEGEAQAPSVRGCLLLGVMGGNKGPGPEEPGKLGNEGRAPKPGGM